VPCVEWHRLRSTDRASPNNYAEARFHCIDASPAAFVQSRCAGRCTLLVSQCYQWVRLRSPAGGNPRSQSPSVQ
jgi:hypothetical protein